MDAATAYFLKKYYPHVIKWWLVTYNPEAVRVWPSKAEKTEALKKERLQLEAEKEKKLALEAQTGSQGTDDNLDDSAFNAATGSYSGLYGKGPVDDQTKEALNTILSISNNQNTVDSLLSGSNAAEDAALKKKENSDVILPPEQDDIVKEANAIYERLLQEAAEDEAKMQAEIEAARQQAEHLEKSQNAG